MNRDIRESQRATIVSRSLYTTLVLATITLMPITCFAQKGEENGPVGIFQSGREYDQFMRGVKSAAYGEGGSPELRAMVPMLNDLALGQEFGTTAKRYGGTNNSEFDLLANPKVRDEIGMVDEQFEELQKMNSQIQRRAASRLRELDFSNRDGLVERLKDIRDEANKELESLFIPEQLERLQQLRNRSRLRRGGSLVDLLTSNPLKDELEITDRQADELRETEKELEREIQEEIVKLRENARKRLLDNLNRDQQDQVETLLGKPFEFQELQNAKGKGKGRQRSKSGK